MSLYSVESCDTKEEKKDDEVRAKSDVHDFTSNCYNELYVYSVPVLCDLAHSLGWN